MTNVLNTIKDKRIIAIIRDIPSEYILDTAEALIAGGITMMEVTFDRSGESGMKNTLACFDFLTQQFGDRILMGAGTVLTEEEVITAAEHGAKYIISPNTDEKVIKKTQELGMVSIPGALTPTEAIMAVNAGADIVKLFPAGNLGIDYIKSIKAPLSHILFSAVGGIHEENIGMFASAGITCFGIGSNLVNKAMVIDGDYGNITKTAEKLVMAMNSING